MKVATLTFSIEVESDPEEPLEGDHLKELLLEILASQPDQALLPMIEITEEEL